MSKKIANEASETLKKNINILKSENALLKSIAIDNTLQAAKNLIRVMRARRTVTLSSGLFLSIFSAYDSFTGDLLTAIYNHRPELFNEMNRTVSVSEIMQKNSFNELRSAILQDEIETFRRKSYVEQFEDLEAKFKMPLKSFERWPHFVECGQRRNLITHCNGIVSDQYLKICRKEGFTSQKPLSIGDVLTLSVEYLSQTCKIIMEVGVKLGQTIWRKVIPNDLPKADEHLSDVIYNFLLLENWEMAQVFGDFALNQKRVSSDLIRKMMIINYAIALKFDKKPKELLKLLASIDWSASINEFRLAEAVLLERFEDAVAFMQRIDQKGDLLGEGSYHIWPLFRDFRTKEIFLEAYEKIYGHPFILELQKNVSLVQATSEEDAHQHSLDSDTDIAIIDGNYASDNIDKITKNIEEQSNSFPSD